MAIWSLTQEKVDKMLRQIGDKEMEIDALIKLTPKDIWMHDLDAFVEEWNTQLADDEKRAKKIASMGRRASKKLGIGAKGPKAAKKKRKMDDSDSPDDSGSDFGPAKKKAAVSKAKAGGLLGYLKEAPPKKPSATEALKKGAATASKQTSMLSYTKKESDLGSDGAMDVEEPAPPAAVPKRGRTAAPKNVKKESPVAEDSDDSDVFAAVAKEVPTKPTEKVTAARTARETARKATKYTVDEDSDSDDSGDPFLDVSSMVKTIGGGSNDRPLFSTTNRPGSGASVHPFSSKGRLGIQKASPIEVDEDETNYEALMPQASPKKPAPRNINDTLMDTDDEDEFGFPSAKKPKITAKPTAKPVANPKLKAPAKVVKAAPKAKAAPAAVVAKKVTQLSPAAKIYAAKLAKAKDVKPAPKSKKPIAVDSDDDEMEDADDLANDILSDEDEDEPTPKPRAAAARPGRRAAAAKPAKYVISDDEVSDEASEVDFDDDESD